MRRLSGQIDKRVGPRLPGVAGGTALSAPTLTRTSGVTTYPVTSTFTRPIDWADTPMMYGVAQRSQDATFATGVTESTPFQITAAKTDYSADTGFAVPASGTWYFRLAAYTGTRPASLNWSNIIGVGDAVAPTITSTASPSGSQFVAGTLQLTANKPGYATITGGLNSDLFTISSSNVISYAAQTVAGNYVVNIQWTTYFGTTATQTITLAVAVNTASAFSFTDVTGATQSTQYTSNTITVAGISGGASLPVTITGGTYSKNGGAYTSAAGTAVNGDTFAVQQTSSASYSTTTNTALTIGTTPDTYSVTVMNDPTAVAFAVPASQPAMINGGNATATLNFTGDFTVGGHGVVYVNPLFLRTVSSITLLAAGASGANISLVQRSVTTGGSWQQEVWACPDAQPIVSGTGITIRVIYSGNMGNEGILIGTLINAPNTVAEATASVNFASGSNPVSTAAVTVPASGVGVCFGFLNATVGNINSNTGTLIATGCNHGGSDIRGAITRQLSAGSWTPTFGFSSGSGSGLMALTWGP